MAALKVLPSGSGEMAMPEIAELDGPLELVKNASDLEGSRLA